MSISTLTSKGQTTIRSRHRPRCCRQEMIGLDTNILVRYLVQDDPAQAKKASALKRYSSAGSSRSRRKTWSGQRSPTAR